MPTLAFSHGWLGAWRTRTSPRTSATFALSDSPDGAEVGADVGAVLAAARAVVAAGASCAHAWDVSQSGIEIAVDRNNSPGRQKWRIERAPFLLGILLRTCDVNHSFSGAGGAGRAA